MSLPARPLSHTEYASRVFVVALVYLMHVIRYFNITKRYFFHLTILMIKNIIDNGRMCAQSCHILTPRMSGTRRYRMKFKMVQFGTLLVLVISIVYMLPPRVGFGHAECLHEPSRWIGTKTFPIGGKFEGKFIGSKPTGATIRGPHDPRGKSFHKPICGKNGDEYVSTEAWYFEGGELDGTRTSKGGHYPHNKHKVYKIELKLEASTGSWTASGSVSPTVDGRFATTSHTGHGSALITLDIFKTRYHEILDVLSYYMGCREHESDEYKWHPDEAIEIGVIISLSEITKQKSGKIALSASGEYGGTSIGGSGEWTTSWSEKKKQPYGEGYGVTAKVGCSWWDRDEIVKKQRKKADVEGSMSDASSHIYAEYDKRTEMCPDPTSGSEWLSETPREDVPHVRSGVN